MGEMGYHAAGIHDAHTHTHTYRWLKNRKPSMLRPIPLVTPVSSVSYHRPQIKSSHYSTAAPVLLTLYPGIAIGILVPLVRRSISPAGVTPWLVLFLFFPSVIHPRAESRARSSRLRATSRGVIRFRAAVEFFHKIRFRPLPTAFLRR